MGETDSLLATSESKSTSMKKGWWIEGKHMGRGFADAGWMGEWAVGGLLYWSFIFIHQSSRTPLTVYMHVLCRSGMGEGSRGRECRVSGSLMISLITHRSDGVLHFQCPLVGQSDAPRAALTKCDARPKVHQEGAHLQHGLLGQAPETINHGKSGSVAKSCTMSAIKHNPN